MTAVWVAVLVALLGLAYYGMWRGWHNRAKRQSDIPEPEWLDGDVVSPGGARGRYVSTTTAGNWLDRVTAHSLGTPSKASLGVIMPDGDLGVFRDSARGFRIPVSQLASVRLERGIAGKVRQPEGIVVITWRLGEHELDTGFRPAHKADAPDVVRLVENLMEGVSHA